MTWVDHHNPETPAVAKVSEVSVSSTAGRGSMHPRVVLAFRPWLMDEPPAWLKADALVRVMIGQGEHAGLVRIVANGKIRVIPSPAGRKAGGPSPLLIKLRGMPAPEFKATPAECDWNAENGGWIEVRIPMTPRAQTAAAPPAAKPPKAEAFSMIKGVISREEAGRRGTVPIKPTTTACQERA